MSAKGEIEMSKPKKNESETAIIAAAASKNIS
jgi:hypothetical protein